jgi:CRP-like cAMP-binding protein
MKKRKPFKLTEQLIKIWKQCVIDYLQRLLGEPLGVLETALIQEGVLKPNFKERGSFLLIPNMKATEAHYLKKGRAKLYTIAENGKQKIFYLWKENEIIVLLKSFRERLPNEKYYIEMIEDSELVSITNFCMDGIYAEHISAHTLTQQIVNLKTERRIDQLDILLTDKSERYALFAERFPDFYLRMTNEEICGFVGINETTLKESRRKLAKTPPKKD